MKREQAEHEVKSFLQGVLSGSILQQQDIQNKEDITTVRGAYQLITLKDGSKGVQGDKGIERLIGAVYLEKQLSEMNLENKWEAVKTKCFLMENAIEQKAIKFEIQKIGAAQNIFAIKSRDLISVL